MGIQDRVLNRQRSDRRGYALLVVLGTLSIIAFLFATSAARLKAQLSWTSTEILLAKRAQEERALLRLATKLFGDASGQVDPSDKIELPFLGDQASLWLQDVGGLIDLNSAAPDLLNLLAREFSVSEDAMERFRQWRRTPHRLQSVTDFARVAEIDPEIVEGLDPFATVYSGRFGVAIEEAPIALQSALRREAWPLPEPWATQPSGQVFKVFLQPSGKTARAIGTIKLRSEEQPERVLELRQ